MRRNIIPSKTQLNKGSTQMFWCCSCSVQGNTLEEFIDHNKTDQTKGSGDEN